MTRKTDGPPTENFATAANFKIDHFRSDQIVYRPRVRCAKISEKFFWHRHEVIRILLRLCRYANIRSRAETGVCAVQLISSGPSARESKITDYLFSNAFKNPMQIRRGALLGTAVIRPLKLTLTYKI